MLGDVVWPVERASVYQPLLGLERPVAHGQVRSVLYDLPEHLPSLPTHRLFHGASDGVR